MYLILKVIKKLFLFKKDNIFIKLPFMCFLTKYLARVICIRINLIIIIIIIIIYFIYFQIF